MPKSPTMSAASQSVSGYGSRGAPVGGVRSPDGAPMPHSHETHLFAAASRPEAMHVGGSVSRTQSGAPSAGAESKWEWDCSAGRQEVWVSGDTAAQAISWPDGAPMSRSHETHLYAAASRPEARHVGGSALQTHGIVAAMRLRGGGGTDDRRHEAQHQRAKEGSGEAAVWADRMLKQLAGSEGKRRMVWEIEGDFKRTRRPPQDRAASRRAEERRRVTEEVAVTKEGAGDDRGRAGKRNWEGVEAAEGSGGMVRESEVEGKSHKRRRMSAQKRADDYFQPAPQGAGEGCRGGE